MRKTLLATTALAAAGAFAAGPVLAADMLSVGVSGYMEQWIGAVGVDKTVDGKGAEVGDGVMQVSDTEFNIRGKLEADNGLTFSVKIEVEGNSRPTGDPSKDPGGNYDSPIDESQLTIGSAFGQVVLGAEDSASVLTHHPVRSAGAVGINCGDAGAWVAGIKGCGPGGFGTSGHGFGDKNAISYYSPRIMTGMGEDKSGVQFGITYIPNYNQEAESIPLDDNDEDGVALGGNYVGKFGGSDVAVSVGHHIRTQTTDVKDQPVDDRTFTNVGLNVGFGAFSFDVAYGEHDGGKYVENPAYEAGSDDHPKYIKKAADDSETIAAGAMYSDGPMAVSLGWIGTEYDDGKEQFLIELGSSYTLAPGVAWRSSLFMAEMSAPGTENGENSTEGAGFVTGIKVNF